VLAEHFFYKIRMRVAENPNTPKDVLRQLANDPSHDVRAAVAGNQACEDFVCRRLARDGDVTVRHALAQNVDTPRFVLEELAVDDNGWVRGEALKTLWIIDRSSGSELRRRRKSVRRRKHREQNKLGVFTHSDEEVAS
jgi:hypothetical protein